MTNNHSVVNLKGQLDMSWPFFNVFWRIAFHQAHHTCNLWHQVLYFSLFYK